MPSVNHFVDLEAIAEVFRIIQETPLLARRTDPHEAQALKVYRESESWPEDHLPMGLLGMEIKD